MILTSSSILNDKSVNDDDIRVFELASYRAEKFSNLIEADFLKKLQVSIMLIKDDLGIKEEDNDRQRAYRMTRLATYLKRHFKDFTLAEFKEAFELYIAKKLFVKDKGSKDGKLLHHYQQFSLDFVTSVLEAYRKHRGKVCTKLIKLIPERAMSAEEREEREAGFVEYFVEFFDKIKRSLNDDEIIIHTYEYFDGFTKLLEANDKFDLSDEQIVRAEVKARKMLERRLQEERDQRRFARETLSAELREIRDGGIPQTREDQLMFFKRRAELAIFLEDCAKRDINFEDLKYHGDEQE